MLVRLLQLLEQFRVLDGRSGKAAQPGHHHHRIRIERAGYGIDRLQNANDLSLRLDRGNGKSAHLDSAEPVHFVVTWILSDGMHHHPLSFADHSSRQPLSIRDANAGNVGGIVPRRRLKDKMAADVIDQSQRHGLDLKRLHRLVEDAAQYILHCQRRVDGSRTVCQCRHDACRPLCFGIKTRIQHRHACLIGNGLHQFKMFFVKRIRGRVNQCQHANHAVTRHERHTDRGFRAAFVRGIVRTAQPAIILAGIGDKHGFAVLHHPSRQTAFHRLTQLLGGMVVELPAVYNSGIDRFAGIVHHHDAAALAAHVLNGSEQKPLQDSAKVQGCGNFATDFNKQFEQGTGATFRHFAHVYNT